MEQHLFQLEQLLNLVAALQPDLPSAELYEIAVNGLADLSGYPTVGLWLRDDQDLFRPYAWIGIKREIAATYQKQFLPLDLIDRLRSIAQPLAEAFWWPTGTDLPPEARPLSIIQYEGGHKLVLPVLYTELLGLVVLASPQPTPDAEQISFIQRCVDHITIATTAARTVAENRQAQARLETLLREQQALLATIDELSTPVLPLVEGVLLLPIVGGVDSRRMHQISDVLLHEISEQRARILLVDITGVPVVDTQVAGALLSLARAAMLMGCRVVMVGIRPEIAQALVGLGVSLDEIITQGSLVDGLKTALAMTDWRIVRTSEQKKTAASRSSGFLMP